ncbi:DUF4837 family protein [Zobellia galactanivorans]|uniref:Conserved hypothetical membrane protein n=1 Tax=Zobellia galactanivorans (strain DSM 12802 / CCUG 47099 / CIP 106680 / NCIMB 13871 / Dsij) TaxID=63186 RepID=G0LB48_ZOBGA|nr:DUF4837 family protein [Zobellia galactanivorans]CAZ95779.1 Conserved hypothetical membrane protein [Zobellia galactanivorans]
MKQAGTLFLLLTLLFSSCKESKSKKYLPSSVGAINSMVVVIDNELWKGSVGDTIRRHFAAPVVGMPMDEPLFTIDQVAPKFFTGSIRNTRSILYVMEDSLNLAHVKTDMYASPQRVGVIKGTSKDEIIENVKAKADDIITAFKDMEIEAAQKRFERSLSKETVLKDKFGISLNIPSIYKVGKQEDNFVWIDREIQRGTANITVYEMPGDSFSNDSTLVKDIVAMRDSIGALYIPGPDVPNKITHMRTEPAFAPYVYPAEIGGLKGVEVRGLWDIKNFPMAGPFLTYILNDKENNRKLVLEGFVFAPATEKRNDLFELEAILKTFKIEGVKN